jgi:hypothetical protein
MPECDKSNVDKGNELMENIKKKRAVGCEGHSQDNMAAAGGQITLKPFI